MKERETDPTHFCESALRADYRWGFASHGNDGIELASSSSLAWGGWASLWVSPTYRRSQASDRVLEMNVYCVRNGMVAADLESGFLILREKRAGNERLRGFYRYLSKEQEKIYQRI